MKPTDIFLSKNNGDSSPTTEILQDLWICLLSREVSLLGRKEVLTGKAKFGILGDGKELPQVAMAKAFKKGDYRSGYYRDQTFMFAMGLTSVEAYFAQLYADTENDPFSGGRQMNAHFATPFIDKNGEWLDLVNRYNVTADISCTAGQMARGLGIAQASKKFKLLNFPGKESISREGAEVSFITIGDASTSEGVFWETINAAAVMQLPMVVSVWDDGYGISVPKKYQTTKNSISKSLNGMLLDENGNGIYILEVKGYDYEELVKTYQEVIEKVRKNHIPALIHVQDLTQPQGHSTSGSHERYKSKDRLDWEKNKDCNEKFIQWIVNNGHATTDEILQMREDAKQYVKEKANIAWDAYQKPIEKYKNKLLSIYTSIINNSIEYIINKDEIKNLFNELNALRTLSYGEILSNARQLQFAIIRDSIQEKDNLLSFINELKELGSSKYNTCLYSNTEKAATRIPVIPKTFDEEPKRIPGYNILNEYFEILFERDERFLAFGEDVGQIGDVNQGFAGLQEKFGKDRVFDTGIREWTIMGQAIGLAMRGFRPIAEIQYLDYLIYGLEPLSDDLATLRYRSNGIQHAPVIIRTRGHRLEGIWHAGSPLGLLVNSLRGIYICVPRDMVQAVGMYNTLVHSDEPALVIESLNGYRIRENRPSNLGEYTVALGTPEIIHEGTDITLVTYGSLVRIAEKAVDSLNKLGISVELIDVQTLLPFDLEHSIVESLKKTNRILFLDEDVDSGATAFMMQKVIEEQEGYKWLDSKPSTLSANSHRTPYGSDGDYFTKPNHEDIVERVYAIMHEANPVKYTSL